MARFKVFQNRFFLHAFSTMFNIAYLVPVNRTEFFTSVLRLSDAEINWPQTVFSNLFGLWRYSIPKKAENRSSGAILFKTAKFRSTLLKSVYLCNYVRLSGTTLQACCPDSGLHLAPIFGGFGKIPKKLWFGARRAKPAKNAFFAQSALRRTSPKNGSGSAGAVQVFHYLGYGCLKSQSVLKTLFGLWRYSISKTSCFR